MNTSESQSTSIPRQSQRLGCSLFILAWLLLISLCELVILSGSVIAGSHSQIYTMKTDGTAPKQITRSLFFHPSIDNWDPSFSPDGTRIVYALKRNDNFDVYVMNADGTQPLQLTNAPGNDADPAWSPDGKHIAFVSRRDDNPEIYIMNADGTDQTRLTIDPSFDEHPAWSPDGTRIIFDSNRYQSYDIFMIHSDGTQLTQLTNSPSNEGSVAWAPDGKQIAFVSLHNGMDEIYIRIMDENGARALTENSVNDSWPAWSPDGRQIAFARDGDIFVKNADGTEETQLTSSPVFEWNPSWSPDAEQMIYVSEGNPATYQLGILLGFVQCIFPLVALIGLIVSLSLGLRIAPRKWPRFYTWIESHPAMIAIEPGAIAGLLAALIGLGITIGTQELPVYGIVPVLYGYFILVLAMILIGPVVGATGGIVGGFIASQFSNKKTLIFVAGVFGGAIAGLLIGFLPNALGWLTP